MLDFQRQRNKTFIVLCFSSVVALCFIDVVQGKSIKAVENSIAVAI
jgi:hypothetical protein